MSSARSAARQAGFGFVRPEGTLRAEGRDADIFIPADKTRRRRQRRHRSACGSNRASVGRMGKLEGRIIDVVERATNRFVGTYFEQAGMGIVQVDGKVFTQADLRRRSRRQGRAARRQGRDRDGPLPVARRTTAKA